MKGKKKFNRPKQMKWWKIGGLMFAAGCARDTADVIAPASAAATLAVSAAEPPPPPRAAAVPNVDHHQHLLSEGARKSTLDWIDGWPKPAIVLPSDIRRFIAAREAAWSDSAALAGLLHIDATYLSQEGGGWVVGRNAVAKAMSETFGRPYRMRPVAARRVGNSAYVAGYYTRGEGDGTSYVGFFYLQLVRVAGGNWQILGETPRFPGPAIEPLVDAKRLVELLDEAGIGRALVYSNAYYFARSETEQLGELSAVKAENDWTRDQAQLFATRLIAVCSVNPLRQYAEAEIERCAASGGFRALKLHFDGSSVDLRKPDHLNGAKAAFAAANRLGLPIFVHLQGTGYGAEYASVFLRQVLPLAPRETVTINHLWGGGGYDANAAAALKVLADAVSTGLPATRKLYFDLAQVGMAAPAEARAEIVLRIRQIGIDRMLYGSDGPEWGGLSPDRHWRESLGSLPLSRDERAAIATNVAPFLRNQGSALDEQTRRFRLLRCSSNRGYCPLSTQSTHFIRSPGTGSGHSGATRLSSSPIGTWPIGALI